MRYPIQIRRDGAFYLVCFPDIPEAMTQGDTLEEARAAALDALETALEFDFEDKREVPMPSVLKRGAEGVELPPSLTAKVLLLNEMLRQNVGPSDLARRMQISKQQANRLTDPRHATKIDGVAEALKVLGRRLELRAV